MLFHSRCICHTHAANPATKGHAKEVPDASDIPFLPAAITSPGAHTSGFSLPSDEGPQELKSIRMSVYGSVPPTASTLSASAGVLINFHQPFPSLPDEFTTKIPFAAAMDAALAARLFFPFISLLKYRSFEYPNELLIISAPFLSAHSAAASQFSSSENASLFARSVRARRNSAPGAKPIFISPYFP